MRFIAVYSNNVTHQLSLIPFIIGNSAGIIKVSFLRYKFIWLPAIQNAITNTQHFTNKGITVTYKYPKSDNGTNER